VNTTPAGSAGEPPEPIDDDHALVEDAVALPKRHRSSATKTAVEWFVLIGAALVIALLIKAFLFQAFYIPSESMTPTLEKNDRVLVNKLSYKLHAVHRGDIVVFTAPPRTDPSVKDLVKRVIGLPGETVTEQDGQIYINDKKLNEPYLPQGTVSDCAAFTPHCFPSGPVPKDEYWVMGDNRPASKDSRYFGFIHKNEIVGRAFIRIWPLNRLDLL
jgi:signal peptidase I